MSVILGSIVFLGPDLPQNEFVAAVNCSGITFMNEKETLQEFIYPEVTEVSTIRYMRDLLYYEGDSIMHTFHRSF